MNLGLNLQVQLFELTDVKRLFFFLRVFFSFASLPHRVWGASNLRLYIV